MVQVVQATQPAHIQIEAHRLALHPAAILTVITVMELLRVIIQGMCVCVCVCVHACLLEIPRCRSNNGPAYSATSYEHVEVDG